MQREGQMQERKYGGAYPQRGCLQEKGQPILERFGTAFERKILLAQRKVEYRDQTHRGIEGEEGQHKTDPSDDGAIISESDFIVPVVFLQAIDQLGNYVQ